MASDENAPLVQKEKEPPRDATPKESGPELGPQRGTTVGRFVVVSELGKGGMGAVYGAFDPQLNRKVAIKLLHSRNAENRNSEGTARLHREAQALARISHPNVVSVHEVGMYEGGVFIAMEFIEGTTLSEWIKGKSRSEILRAFGEAGEGLSAVHHAGLVHRDFKANNVIVSKSGRVKLLDLGLARLSDGNENSNSGGDSNSADDISGDSAQSLKEPLTQVGHVTGTRGYIAPEILAGKTATPLSDQFSFGVAVYKALVGKLPFRSRSLWDYSVAVTSGQPVVFPSEAKVPKWLVAVVQRALSAQPENRFATMGEMLRALRSDPTQARRRRMFGAALLLVLAGIVAGVLRATDPGCQNVEALLRTSWPDGSMERLEQALTLQRPALASVVRRGVATLDARIREWAFAYEKTCLEVHPRFAPVIPSRKMTCLERHGQQFAVLIDTLSNADSLTASKSAELISDFTRDPACLRRVDRRTADDVPAEFAVLARRLRLDLFRANAQFLAGHYSEGLSIAVQVADAAREANLTGFEAEARHLTSGIRRELGESDAATQEIKEAFRLAIASGLDDIALRDAATLAQLLSDERDQLTLAKEFWQIAESLLVRLGSPRDLDIEVGDARVDIAYVENRKEDMVAYAASKEVASRKEFGEYSFEHGVEMGLYGYALWQVDRPVESADASQKAIEILEVVLGKDDPRLTYYYRVRGSRLGALGRDEESGAVLEHALKLAKETLDKDSRDTLNAMLSLSNHYLDADPQRGLMLVSEAIEMLEKKHMLPSLSKAYRVRSNILAKLQRGTDALVDCERSRNAATGLIDIDGWRTQLDARCRATAFLAMSRPQDAWAELERAKKYVSKDEIPSERAAIALESALVKRALKAPVEEVKSLCAQGLKEIESFPPTSFVKRNLMNLMSAVSAKSPRGPEKSHLVMPVTKQTQ